MTTWTKELPKESGWFWYRETPTAEPEIGLLQYRGGDDGTLLYLWRLAPKSPLGGMFYAKIDGGFWPVRILPPDEAQQTWRESDQTFADMKAYRETLPKGLITIHDPALPQPIPVKIDPNQPHA